MAYTNSANTLATNTLLSNVEALAQYEGGDDNSGCRTDTFSISIEIDCNGNNHHVEYASTRYSCAGSWAGTCTTGNLSYFYPCGQSSTITDNRSSSNC